MKNLKKIIVESVASAGEGHIASAFSILDILSVLYDKILKYDAKNPCNPSRDRFFLSKGHASLGLYVILAEKGFFPKGELAKFGKYDSILGGHPDRNKVPGVEASTGSLGHGFPIAVGTALGLKIQKNNARIFVLIGDGEANEGTIWESSLLAAHHNLTNITCIVDYNHSTDRALLVGDLVKKFEAFGWNTIAINGHDHEEILTALKARHETKPTAIIAETLKGNGVKIMENNPAWHHKVPNNDELALILEELS
ncbi:MAG: transketolase [Patescibacteria group bacterium]